MSSTPHPLTGNTFAKKPLDQHITGKGRLTVDLGTDLHRSLISYAKHEKRKINEITKDAISRYLDDPPHTQHETLPQCDPE